MTHDEAVTRAEQLNQDDTSGHHWFPKQIGSEEWELVSVAVPGFTDPRPLRTATQATAKPQAPPDPRSALARNVPPYGGA
jgi:hypothetical protein